MAALDAALMLAQGQLMLWHNVQFMYHVVCINVVRMINMSPKYMYYKYFSVCSHLSVIIFNGTFG